MTANCNRWWQPDRAHLPQYVGTGHRVLERDKALGGITVAGSDEVQRLAAHHIVRLALLAGLH